MTKSVELKITVDDKGSVNVTGPVHNKVMAYAMLELARDAIKDLHDRAANDAKIAVVGSIPGGM